MPSLQSDDDKLIELPESRGSKTKKYFIGEKVITSELDFWKEMRRMWLAVIIEGVMKEYNSKLELARVWIT